MIESIDQILIGVNDAEAAAIQYQQVLGCQPSWRGYWPSFDCELIAFQLSNCCICLCSPAGQKNQVDGAGELVDFLAAKGEGIFALIFASSDLTQSKASLNTKGINFGPEADLDTVASAGYEQTEGRIAAIASNSFSHLRGLVVQAKEPGATQGTSLYQDANSQNAVTALDHLVVNTHDAEALKINFQQLGFNLRLDQNIEQWGARQLFYRIGQTVLEVIAFNDEKLRPQANEYWGLALKTLDIDQAQARMLAQGIAISKVRKGRKAGTRVASLKSHNLGVATLLIGPEPD